MSFFTANQSYQTVTLPVQMAEITDGDVLTTYTPGYSGRIIKADWVQQEAVTTASKLSTLNLEIGTTNVTGGTMALTSATCTPTGVVIAGAAITAENRFGPADTISIEGSSTTAFSEGTGYVALTLGR